MAIALQGDIEVLLGRALSPAELAALPTLQALAQAPIEDYIGRSLDPMGAALLSFRADAELDRVRLQGPVTNVSLVMIDGVTAENPRWSTYGTLWIHVPVGGTVDVVYDHGWATPPAAIVAVLAGMLARAFAARTAAEALGATGVTSGGIVTSEQIGTYSYQVDPGIAGEQLRAWMSSLGGFSLSDDERSRLRRFRQSADSQRIRT